MGPAARIVAPKLGNLVDRYPRPNAPEEVGEGIRVDDRVAGVDGHDRRAGRIEAAELYGLADDRVDRVRAPLRVGLEQRRRGAAGDIQRPGAVDVGTAEQRRGRGSEAEGAAELQHVAARRLASAEEAVEALLVDLVVVGQAIEVSLVLDQVV